MPEGDSVAVDALRLGPALLGCTVRDARSRRHGRIAGLVGRAIVSLECRGKHLLVCFDGGVVAHVHRGMTGSWIPFATAPRSLEGIDLALDLGEHWTIAQQMPVMKILRPREVERSRALTALGPDLLGLIVAGSGPLPLPEPDWAAIVQNARSAGGDAASMLLNQRIAAGLGNVYKCELLLLHGVHPWTQAEQLPLDRVRSLYEEGRRLMIDNSRPGPRTTRGIRGTGATWVYGRSGRPCHRCGTPIRRHGGTGERPRVTDWCPSCQRARGD